MDDDENQVPPNSRIPARELTREEIEEYLEKAGLRQLGIWYDTNAIIVWLSRQLLKLMDPKK
jgi:hypothetical protein